MMAKYLRNTWYSTGWAHDLGDEPRAMEIIETPVVIFRDSQGNAQVPYAEPECKSAYTPKRTEHDREPFGG